MQARQLSLTNRIQVDHQRHRRLLAELSTLTEAIARRQASAAALKSTLQLAYGSVDPSLVPAVHAWSGKYGTRGALKAFVTECLRTSTSCPTSAPAQLTTTELVDRSIAHFGLNIATPNERTKFRLLISGYLRRMLKDDLVVAVHLDTGALTGTWRWKEAPGLAALRLRALQVAGGPGVAEGMPDGRPTHSNPT